MSKRNVILLVSLLAALAVVVAAIVLLLSNPPEEESNELLLVSDIPYDSIQAMTITGESGVIRVERQGDGWTAAGSDMTVDSLTCESMATYLSYVYAVDVVEQDASDPGQYGLDNPSLTAELMLSDGSQTVFTFGVPTTDQSAVYFMRSGDGSVYTMRSDHFAQIRSTLTDIVDLSLPAVDGENISSLSYKRGRLEQSVVRSDKFESGFAFEQSGAAASDAFMTQVKKTAKARLNSYVGSEVKPEYGLDSGDYIRIADTAGVEMLLHLGSKTEDGKKYYCTVEGKDGVYLLDEPYTAFMVDDVALCMDTRLMPVAADSIVSVSWQGQGQQIELADGTTTVNGQPQGTDAYEALMGALKEAQASGIIDTDAGGALCSLTVKLSDGGSLEVKLCEYLKGFYALDYGSGPSLYIKADALKLLTEVQ